jgi:hypothetical protein
MEESADLCCTFCRIQARKDKPPLISFVLMAVKPRAILKKCEHTNSIDKGMSSIGTAAKPFISGSGISAAGRLNRIWINARSAERSGTNNTPNDANYA